MRTTGIGHLVSAPALKFGTQANTEVSAIKALCPGLEDSYTQKLAGFIPKLTEAGKKALYTELETLGTLEAKTENFNPKFAQHELIVLILESKWSPSFTPDQMVDEAIYISRRRNSERGQEKYDDFGCNFLVGHGRQIVQALKAEDALAHQGASPGIIAETKKNIEGDLSYVGEALRNRMQKQ